MYHYFNEFNVILFYPNAITGYYVVFYGLYVKCGPQEGELVSDRDILSCFEDGELHPKQQALHLVDVFVRQQ